MKKRIIQKSQTSSAQYPVKRVYFFLVHPVYYTFVGAIILEGVSVESINTKNNMVSSVTTNKGEISCEIFINCAGQVLFCVYYEVIYCGGCWKYLDTPGSLCTFVKY